MSLHEVTGLLERVHVRRNSRPCLETGRKLIPVRIKSLTILLSLREFVLETQCISQSRLASTKTSSNLAQSNLDALTPSLHASNTLVDIGP